MNSALMDIILNFEYQLSEMIFNETFKDERSDKEYAAIQMKEYLSQIKELVNDEKDVEIKQKL